MTKSFQHIGLGGTFDHFHKGHRFFLDFAAEKALQLHVGITTNEFVHEKILREQIEPFEQRKNAVETYLKSRGIPFQTFALSDTFGPTLENSVIDALAVTELTQKGGERINAERSRRNLTQLPIFTYQMVQDENGGVISSTRIRTGEINRDGRVYANLFRQDIKLSEQQRKFFQEIQGAVVQEPTSFLKPTYVVGDIVLETFLQNNWPFDLGVFDQKNNRQTYQSPLISALQLIKVVDNEAGKITQHMIQTLQEMISSRQPYLLIHGEEDLAALALAFLTPLGSGIYYGQPNIGMIEMKVTEALKEKFFQQFATT